MSNNQPPANPPWWHDFKNVMHLAAWLLNALQIVIWTLVVLSRGGTVPPPQPPVPDPPLIVQRGSQGWIDDPELAAQAQRAAGFPEFTDTPAGHAILNTDKPVALWKSVEKAWQRYNGPAKDSRPYPAENQQDVGCCVGCGTKHAADATYAVEIHELGEREQWKPLAIEPIYAAGRVDIGGGKIRGDGSIGGWSAQAAKTIGFAPMETVGGADLSKFDRLRARDWGRRGMPAAVKAESNKHKMGNAARVRSWDECKKALAQGYAIFLCSNVGFEGRKDADGFIRANGQWAHCMALLGYRVDRDGGLILNSWGPDMHRGAAGWGDPPPASFWAEGSTIDRMCRSGECYALSSLQGFPARRVLEWPVHRRDKRQFELFETFDSAR